MTSADLVVVGAGAAGLASAIFAARAAPGARIVCVDGARRIGAKILVSGGSRCNVTNRVVTERDFWGGSPRVVRNVLRAFSAEEAAAFFRELEVFLHEEEDGKLFPDTNRARSVLDALLNETERLGITIATETRVSAIEKTPDAFVVHADSRSFTAAHVVLATGGRSLPKTGSDGFGYELARRLGHGHVEATPALAPLVLREAPVDGHITHGELAGVSHPAELALRIDKRVEQRLAGALLWTHFGMSGPLALNMSRHWHRAALEKPEIDVRLNLCPGESFESIEAWLIGQETARPRARISTVLATRLPMAVADACVSAVGLDGVTTMAHVPRDRRRSLVRMLVDSPVPVVDSRGYSYAEVTAGGVPLDEIDSATMQSRVCPGLYIVGEILDVDGRLGGFNFQWAWSSGWVAGNAIARVLRD